MPSALEFLLSQLRRDLENAEAPLRSQMVLAYESAVATLELDLYQVTWLIDDARNRGEEITPEWLYQQERYQRIIVKAEAQLARFSDDAMPIVESTFRSGARVGVPHGQSLLSAGGINVGFGTNINTQAVDVIYQTMFREGPIRDVLDSYGGNATAVIRHQMGQGVILGKGPREVVDEIMRDLISGTNRARLGTLVRTEHMRAYRGSLDQQFESYKSQIRRYRWVAAKQARTCLACLALDGTESDEPRGKHHPNCRCLEVPLGRYTPDRYRTYQTGEAWFREQPASTQRAMMPSQAAFDAYQRGEIGLQDFVGHRHSDVWGESIYEMSGREVLAASGNPVPTVRDWSSRVHSDEDRFQGRSELSRSELDAWREAGEKKMQKDIAVRSWNEYKYGDYESINAAMRDGQVSPADERRLASFGKSRLKSDAQLYRGFAGNPDADYLSQIPENGLGGIIQDKAYISTSSDPYVAERFADDISDANPQAYTLSIRAPKGMPAVGVELDGYNRESEIVLPPGTKFGIFDRHIDDSGRIVFDVIPFPGDVDDEKISILLDDVSDDPNDAVLAAEKYWKKWKP